MVAAALLSLSCCTGGTGALSQQPSSPAAVAGTIDLREPEVENAGPVQLRGEWLFSWSDRDSAQPVPVPQSWTEYRSDGSTLPPSGFARYTLIVLLPRDIRSVSVEFVRVSTAYRLYANGTLTAEVGRYGSDAAHSNPERRPLTADVLPEDGRLKLELLVSNYHDGSAGITAPVLLGTRAELEARGSLSVALEAAAIGAFLVIVLLNLVFFVHRRDQIGHLWTAVMSAVEILYLVANGTQVLTTRLSWEVVFRTEVSSFVAGLAFVLPFLRSVYPDETPAVVAYTPSVLSLLWAAFAWVAPTQIVSASVPGIRILYAATYGCAVAVLLRCAAHRRPGVAILLGGGGILLVTLAVDFSTVLAWRSFGAFLTPFGGVAFFASQSILLSRQFSFLNARTVALNAELMATNAVYSRFVPTQFLQHLRKAKITDVALGDETRTDMGILFSDIRSFTSMAEQLSPPEVFHFLNRYLAVMEPVVRSNGGFIDKYIGDGIMALFPRSPQDGLRAAAEMLAELHRLNGRRASEGLPPIAAGRGAEIALGRSGETRCEPAAAAPIPPVRVSPMSAHTSGLKGDECECSVSDLWRLHHVPPRLRHLGECLCPQGIHGPYDSRFITDEDIAKAFDAQPQKRLPASVAWYDMGQDNLVEHVKLRNANILTSYDLPPLLIEGVNYYGASQSYRTPQPVDLLKIRLFAARAKCDIVILLSSSLRYVSKPNWLTFAGILILPAIFVPMRSVEYVYQAQCYVFDVRNGRSSRDSSRTSRSSRGGADRRERSAGGVREAGEARQHRVREGAPDPSVGEAVLLVSGSGWEYRGLLESGRSVVVCPRQAPRRRSADACWPRQPVYDTPGKMRYAVIADIHGNWPALQAVLSDIGRQHVDAVYCLGDLFAPFGFVSEIATALRDSAILTIRGNSEDRMLSMRDGPQAAAGSVQLMPTRAVMEHLTEGIWQFIGDLPRVRTVYDGLARPLVLCHGTPRDSAAFLFRPNGDPNLRAIAGTADGTIVAGHNHWAKEMRHGNLRVIYAGSVGLQFDEEHRVAYVLLETKDGAVGPAEYRFVRHDWQAFAATLVGQGFLRRGGPISWIMFDELLCQHDWMVPFLRSSHAAGLANTTSAWAVACRAFLSAKGRWSHIEPYLR